METINILVKAELKDNGNFEAYIGSDEDNGFFCPNVSPEKIGEVVAEEIRAAIKISEKEPDKLYLYKEYCDEEAYGEELTELYASRTAAVARLKERVEQAYGMPFVEIPLGIELDDRDTFTEDYVSIDNGDGAVSFWVVEGKEVK